MVEGVDCPRGAKTCYVTSRARAEKSVSEITDHETRLHSLYFPMLGVQFKHESLKSVLFSTQLLNVLHVLNNIHKFNIRVSLRVLQMSDWAIYDLTKQNVPE